MPLIQRLNTIFQNSNDELRLSFNSKIPISTLYDRLQIGDIFPLYITQVHNPLVFFFRSKNDEHILNDLTTEMQKYYSALAPHELSVSDSFVQSGNLCAVKINNKWFRAKIINAASFFKIVVNFIDFGCIGNANSKHLKYLTPLFSNVPMQVSRGRLANIKNDGKIRSAPATNFLKSLVYNRCLYAYVTKIDKDTPQMELILLDTSVVPKVHINKLLISKGFAVREN